MEQSELFIEDENDAWDAVIKFLGGYKKVSGWLWPNLKSDTGYAKLKNCFREDKDENLLWRDAKKILRAAREAGCHVAMYHLCDETFYERPNPASKERVKAELKTQAGLTVERLESILQRLERLEAE